MRIFDHPDFIICHKPHGVNMHYEATNHGALPLLGFMQQMINTYKLSTLYMVHRLDKDTSGLVIFAKSAQAAREFGAMFENKKIQKMYLALTDAKPSKKEGWIKGDMKKGRNGSWLITREQFNPAITQFKTASYQILNKAFRLAILKPKTGKTHQLRVALKSLGAPILGDIRYKGTQADRLYLHAYSLAFTFQKTPFYFVCKPDTGQFFDNILLDNTIKPFAEWCNA